MAAEPGAPPDGIGVYDSRVIACAHFWSDARQRELNALTKAAMAAKASGQTERFNELEAAIKKEQETNHLQVFSTAPVDEALVALKDRLLAIQKEAGVATLVSKWDEVTLNAHNLTVPTPPRVSPTVEQRVRKKGDAIATEAFGVLRARLKKKRAQIT
jgi:type IV pilus biogenesis protein CpaD/CtpE